MNAAERNNNISSSRLWYDLMDIVIAKQWYAINLLFIAHAILTAQLNFRTTQRR